MPMACAARSRQRKVAPASASVSGIGWIHDRGGEAAEELPLQVAILCVKVPFHP
jgi:hypothetical protein